MGKGKYRKRIQSVAGSKKERNTSSVFKASSSSKDKEEKKTIPLSVRHFQRRLAITPDDINDDERLIKAYRNFVQNTSVDKGHDGLHLAKQNKRAKKRMLARKKLAGAFGNMGSLVDALPSVKEDNKNSSGSVKEKPRVCKSLKSQEFEMLNDIHWYHHAVQDPSFLADPFAAVASNIHLRLKSEQKESS
ncbi:uncharacterized protein LOC129964297 isoform X2 [Argiope bruennichi]|uniref:Uncharacterized protein n=1 Tax=Argiope bruennichi TaxID=94029 RepID=A0A8T0EVA8_ARGBR|nr:uncharacterized protein LOC129964297 isoform X2 [Argiope bruennichi]KAF8781681.1 hypothetical protein HNY73_012055 [Argiope bruennichi]